MPILTDDEIARLLKTCAVSRGRPGAFDRTVFLGRRDEVVLRLLLDTGVRVSELCGLALTDVDLGHADALTLVVGPEGGISDDVIAALTAAGAVAVRLGPTVLRTSTAAAVALGALGALTSRWSAHTPGG